MTDFSRYELSYLNVRRLKQLCRDNSFYGFSKKRKTDLIQFILDCQALKKNNSNSLRRENCRRIGGKKKRQGHEREKLFNNQFGDSNATINYGPTFDCIIVDELLLYRLKLKFNIEGRTCSLKGGRNLQFVLGRIDEMTNDPLGQIELNTQMIFKKYLKKTDIDFFVYFEDATKNWIFFNMNDVVDFITHSCSWRLLQSGQIKGDFFNPERNRKLQYITYEYRSNKGFFLGCNGNRGLAFIQLLKICIPYHYEESLTRSCPCRRIFQ